MSCFATGFISHFEYTEPVPWGHVDNYDPLRGSYGSVLLRSRMRDEVLAGRMIGGPGWSSSTVRRFFGGLNFWGVPCGATAKDGDPCGRIIHDYGYYRKGSYSINATHSSTSVVYTTFKERMQIPDNVS